MSGRKRKLSTYRSKTKMKIVAAEKKEKKKEITVVPRYERISSASSDEYVNVLDDSNEDISSNGTEGEVLSGPGDVDEILNVTDEMNENDSNGRMETFKDKCVEELFNPVIMREIVEKMWGKWKSTGLHESDKVIGMW